MSFLELLIILGPAVVTDLKRREIPVYYCLASGVFFLLLRFMIFRDVGAANLFGFFLGIFFIFISLGKHRAFGMGDGIMFLVMGSLWGAVILMEVLIISLILVIIYGTAERIFRKKKGRREYPLAPFLFTGAFLYLMLSGSFL